MTEFSIGEHTFRIDGMSPKKAFHIGRRIMPVLGGLKGLAPFVGPGKAVDLTDLDTMAAVLKPLGDVLAEMSDQDADYILDGCMGVVKLQLPGGTGWAPIHVGSNLMYDWITMPMMLQIVFRVVQKNLSGFLAAGALAG